MNAPDHTTRSGSSVLLANQAARIAEAIRPATDAAAVIAEVMRPVTDAVASMAEHQAAMVPTLPESVARWFRRWASMSPRQRRASLVAELRAGLSRAGANLRAALDRGIGRVADLLVLPPARRTDAEPPNGPPLSLVLIASTRPTHAPPALAF